MINEYMLYLGDDWHQDFYMDIYYHEVYGVVTRQQLMAERYAGKG